MKWLFLMMLLYTAIHHIDEQRSMRNETLTMTNSGNIFGKSVKHILFLWVNIPLRRIFVQFMNFHKKVPCNDESRNTTNNQQKKYSYIILNNP